MTHIKKFSFKIRPNGSKLVTCPFEQELGLTGTAINGEMLADWLEHHTPRRLKSLNLFLCPFVSGGDVNRIRNVLPQCDIRV